MNTLTLTDGAGTANATFEGTIQGKPFSNSVLICYVHDKNHPSDITFNETGEYYYADGTFTTQDGTMAGAAKCNVYYGTTTYGTGKDITCTFGVNTSMMKFMVTAPDEVKADDADSGRLGLLRVHVQRLHEPQLREVPRQVGHLQVRLQLALRSSCHGHVLQSQRSLME